MSDNSDGIFSCKGICWITATVLGIVGFLILEARVGMGFMASLFLAVVLLVIVALILRQVFCSDETDAPVAPAKSTPAPAEVAKAPAGAPGAPKKGAAPKPASAPKDAPAQKEASARKGATAPVASDEGEKPQTLDAPRGGKADDLKQLKGVGPALEKMLNDLGFYHFDQVAGWDDAQIEWVDSRLKFKGRIVRDGWVAQAATLADGGTTEFSKRVKKGDVY